ncbi:hypothetical protein H8356DRAFT_1321559 [Neocallimastix lanati (nom. inval.)]|nr:hypothetical protein H8356DRAFT_1321559 [Neocallimastix sp. JGI-2020a]
MVQVDLSLLLHTGLLNMKIDNMNKFSFVMKTKMVKDIPSISLPYYNDVSGYKRYYYRSLINMTNKIINNQKKNLRYKGTIILFATEYIRPCSIYNNKRLLFLTDGECAVDRLSSLYNQISRNGFSIHILGFGNNNFSDVAYSAIQIFAADIIS